MQACVFQTIKFFKCQRHQDKKWAQTPQSPTCRPSWNTGSFACYFCSAVECGLLLDLLLCQSRPSHCVAQTALWVSADNSSKGGGGAKTLECKVTSLRRTGSAYRAHFCSDLKGRGCDLSLWTQQPAPTPPLTCPYCYGCSVSCSLLHLYWSLWMAAMSILRCRGVGQPHHCNWVLFPSVSLKKPFGVCWQQIIVKNKMKKCPPLQKETLMLN